MKIGIRFADFRGMLTSGRYIRRLLIKTDERIVIVTVTLIDCIESAGNYVAVKSGKECYILRKPLITLEAQLDPHRFVRISRSVIVNLDRVKEIQPMFQGEHVLVLQDGKRFPVTRKFRDIEETLRFG